MSTSNNPINQSARDIKQNALGKIEDNDCFDVTQFNNDLLSVFLRESKVDQLSDQINSVLDAQGESLEMMLTRLRTKRERRQNLLIS